MARDNGMSSSNVRAGCSSRLPTICKKAEISPTMSTRLSDPAIFSSNAWIYLTWRTSPDFLRSLMIQEHAVMSDSTVPWSRDINFASALLLHSCTTVLLKETLNLFEIIRRLCLRSGATPHRKTSKSPTTQVSAVLDAYTSVFSNDVDAEQAELYFTNTGLALLATSLTSSVVMNLFFSDLALNILVACTFGLTFAASIAVGHYKYSLLFMALRRAGRFIWSDTPFVNFFTLIYIATVLRGKSTLRLQDYITFRSIAIIEWVLMKAKLASAAPDSQVTLMRRLIASKRVLLHEQRPEIESLQNLEVPSRNDIAAFTTTQRMRVMFGKSSIGYEFGSVTRSGQSARIPVPAVGTAVDSADLGWKLYRFSESVMILVDCLAESKPKSRWARFCKHAHGMLLRRIGKKRAVYLIQKEGPVQQQSSQWHSDRNLVTGVSGKWLEESFAFGEPPAESDSAWLL